MGGVSLQPEKHPLVFPLIPFYWPEILSASVFLILSFFILIMIGYFSVDSEFGLLVLSYITH